MAQPIKWAAWIGKMAKEKEQESPTDQKSEAETLIEVPVRKASATVCFPIVIIKALYICISNDTPHCKAEMCHCPQCFVATDPFDLFFG